MAFDMRLHGLSGALQAIEGLERARMLAAAKAALSESLEGIRSEAALLCPKDTGALAASIGVRLREEEGALSGEVFAAQSYAVPVEMGTASRAAQPFLYPAMAAGRADTLRRIADALAETFKNGGDAR